MLTLEYISSPNKNETINIQKQERVPIFHECHPDYAYITICVAKIRPALSQKKGARALRVCDIFLSPVKKFPCKLPDRL
jgi:hypothetical protein